MSVIRLLTALVVGGVTAILDTTTRCPRIVQQLGGAFGIALVAVVLPAHQRTASEGTRASAGTH